MAVLGNRILPDAIKWGRSANAQVVSRKYQLRLATPMFGGGVIAGTSDERMPIRPRSIRGHLRYWWRMMHREKFLKDDRTLDVAAMRLREAEIWGSTESPSAVQIRVRVQELTDSNYLTDERYGFAPQSPEAYALFSAIEGKVPRIVRQGLEFQVELSWPEQTELNRLRKIENKQRRSNNQLSANVQLIDGEVDLAFNSWIAFGGIGARTRRGLGSLECVDSTGSAPSSLPCDAQLFVIDRAVTDPMHAWRQVVDVYQRFRQSFRGAKHKKAFPGGTVGEPPGRSHWPEPDSIRMLTRCALSDGPTISGGTNDVDTHNHATPIVAQNEANFPRAVLGLPIGFHFAGDGPGKNNPANPKKDPASVELLPHAVDEAGNLVYEVERGGTATRCPKSGDRMASPVITKAMQLDGKWYAAVLILPHDQALRVNAVLKGNGARWNTTTNSVEELLEEIPNSQIVGSHLAALCPTPMSNPMRGHSNAIAAFVGFLGEKQDGANPPVAKPTFESRTLP